MFPQPTSPSTSYELSAVPQRKKKTKSKREKESRKRKIADEEMPRQMPSLKIRIPLGGNMADEEMARGVTPLRIRFKGSEDMRRAVSPLIIKKGAKEMSHETPPLILKIKRRQENTRKLTEDPQSDVIAQQKRKTRKLKRRERKEKLRRENSLLRQINAEQRKEIGNYSSVIDDQNNTLTSVKAEIGDLKVKLARLNENQGMLEMYKRKEQTLRVENDELMKRTMEQRKEIVNYSSIIEDQNNSLNSLNSELVALRMELNSIEEKNRDANRKIQELEAATPECSTCLSALPNIVLQPCSHLAVCQDCTPTLLAHSNRCPICRSIILDTKKVYYV